MPPKDPLVPLAPFPLSPADLAKTTPSRDLRHLYNALAKSTDHLFFASVPPDPWTTASNHNRTWQLIQVVWLQVDRMVAHTEGTYPFQRFCPHFNDTANRAIVDCRFIPDIWEWMPSDNRHVQRNVNPTRHKLALSKNPNLSWPVQSLSLGQYLIHGPFDFSKLRPPAYLSNSSTESYRIANAYWNVLEDRACSFSIDTSNIRDIPHSRT